MSVVRLERVTVLDASSVVVETPVAPVIAPALVILMVGDERKLLNPVADAKLMPLITFVLLLDAAGKLIPLRVLVLLVLVELVKAMLMPLTAVVVALVFAFVKANAELFALLVLVE